MSQKCFNPKCDNPVTSIAGKRPRKYCSSRCTSAHWQALHYEPKNPKRVILIPDESGQWQTMDGKRCKLVWDKIPVIAQNKPQEPTKTKKEGKATQKEKAAVNGAENTSGEPIRGKDENPIDFAIRKNAWKQKQ